MTHFFDMVVSGKTDYDQMALASLGVNKKIKNEFIQLDRNLSTPVNTGAEQYCHRGWMLTCLLFCRFSDMKEFYYLALRLGKIYSDYDSKDVARSKLALWFNQVEQWNCEEFNTVIKTFQSHYDRVLNFFNDKRTNASAELFNCKLKTFRAEFRGVNDLNIFIG